MSIKLGVLDLPNGVKSVNIKEQKVFDGLPFPLTLSPSDDFKHKDVQFWNDWIKENLKVIESLLLKYGAILFRGFPLETDTDFDEFTKAFEYDPFSYSGGVSLRQSVLGNVYTATDVRPGGIIPFHHEMAYAKDYPHIVFFYCDIPAKEGGETPIALSNVIYRKMMEREHDFVSLLEREGLRYVRVAPDGDDVSSSLSALGRGWQSTFYTSSKAEAEMSAKSSGYQVDWLDDGSMKTTTEVLPAIRMDKRTGKKMWFNMFFAFYIDWHNGGNNRRADAIFPNGDTVSAETIETLKKVMDEAKVSFTWQHTDVIMIDNRTVQHCRNEFFVPPRRVLASLYKDHQGPL